MFISGLKGLSLTVERMSFHRINKKNLTGIASVIPSLTLFLHFLFAFLCAAVHKGHED